MNRMRHRVAVVVDAVQCFGGCSTGSRSYLSQTARLCVGPTVSSWSDTTGGNSNKKNRCCIESDLFSVDLMEHGGGRMNSTNVDC